MYRVVVCFLFALILTPGSIALSDEEKSKSLLVSLYWEQLKSIEKFAILHLDTEGSAEKIGVKQDELQDYLRLRFKNSFSRIESKPDKGLMESFGKLDFDKAIKYGTILIRVWTVGEDDHVSYHIQLLAGNLVDRKLYDNEVLGFDSKKNMPNVVRNTISDLVDEFAIFFFKNRNEL